ncbi:hypothetical protein [Sediminibacterium sp.]|uniref:hypothetical protein n=1 Tax=Sediminibacterium sp. TaxID=1917865 RepID=UPI002720349F|nr:hypothetical protein [Sediminibacterium sp.]MDO9156241.1 hypothetical protein [Sediminibacterium sp.]MDP2422333.1 hypothetical protein [Sediminibacterium sp.]
MITIALKPFYYKGIECISIHGPNTAYFKTTIKKLTGIFWCHKERIWFIKCTREAFEHFKKQATLYFYLNTDELRKYLEQRSIVNTDITEPIKKVTAISLVKFPLSKDNILAYESMRNKLIVKGYSPNTVLTP